MRFAPGSSTPLVALAAALFCVMSQPGFGQEFHPPPGPPPGRPGAATLTVTGHGEVQARPDKAAVRLGAQEQAETAMAAQQAVNTAMQKVLAEIKKLGIPENRLRTAGLTLSPVFAPPKPNAEPEPARVIGYRASNTVQIDLTDPRQIGAVIDAGNTAGANRVEGVSFGLADDLPFRTEALRLAAREAQAKASALAEALGVKLISVRRVNQEAMNIPRPLSTYSGMARAATAATPVEPGEITVEASITVEYQIGPKDNPEKR